MSSFIQLDNMLVNLQNVCNINIKNDSYKKRIIFNMNYNIEINTNNGLKMISDYVYWDSHSETHIVDSVEELYNNDYFVNNFIHQGSPKKGYININEISSIKYSPHKNRVIFNLSHPISFVDYDKSVKVTSEFIFVDFNTTNELNDYVEYIKGVL